MVSEKSIALLIKKRNLHISDEEFFQSGKVRDYFTRLAHVLLVGKETKQTPEIYFICDKDDTRLAFSNPASITFNLEHEWLKGEKLEEKFQLLKGLMAHELAHFMFTDFEGIEEYLSELQHGYIQINWDQPMASELVSVQRAIAKFQGEKEEHRKAYADVAMQIYNVFEDAYVEAAFANKYPGRLRASLDYLRRVQYEKMIEQMETEAGARQNFLLLLCYSKFGQIPPSYREIAKKWLDSLHDKIQAACTSNSIENKKMCVQECMILWWQQLIEYFMEQERKGSFFQNGMEGYSCICSGNHSQIMEEKSQNMRFVPFGEVPKKVSFFQKEIERSKNELQDMYEECLDRRAREALEEERMQQLNTLAKSMEYGPGSERVSVYVERRSAIPTSFIEKYEKIQSELEKIASALQMQVKEKIQVAKNGSRIPGQYYGRCLDSKSLIRKDGRYFYRRVLPHDSYQMTIGIVVDESGSMKKMDRQEGARNTAVILYNFCKKSGFPVCIYGHSADERGPGTVGLYSYVEFESIDQMDVYRLMGISAKARNRDSVPIQYVGQLLKNRPEKRKLMIVITDGKPNAYGYGGEYAKRELSHIKRELSHDKIQMIIAAIGEDKEEIESIYQNGYLDITDVKRLPWILTNLIRKMIW